MLTHADDMLGPHEHGGGAAKQWLLTTLGMNESELAVLDEITAQNVKTVREVYSNDWSKAVGFAEDVVVQFMRLGPEFAHLFAHDTAINQFPLTTPYFNALLERVDASESSSNEKGLALEDLASYIFSLVPGWVPRRNVVSQDSGIENDLVVSNLARGSNLMTALFGRHFLVECKNWVDHVGVEKVGYFLYRMHLTHAKFGVMFAKTGITGNDMKAAHSLIKNSFHEDDNICIVLKREDLSRMAKDSISLWGLLLERIEEVRFGKPKMQKAKDEAMQTSSLTKKRKRSSRNH